MATEDYSAQGGGTYSNTTTSSGSSSSSTPKQSDLKFGYDVKTGIQYDAGGNVVSTPGQVTQSVDRTVQPGISATDKPGEFTQKAAQIGYGAPTAQIEARYAQEDAMRAQASAQKQYEQRYAQDNEFKAKADVERQQQLKFEMLQSKTSQMNPEFRRSEMDKLVESGFAKYEEPKPDTSFLTEGFAPKFNFGNKETQKEDTNAPKLQLNEKEWNDYQKSLKSQPSVLSQNEANKRALLATVGQNRYSQYQKELDNYYNPQYTMREYTSRSAPISFQIEQGIKNTIANIGSWDVLSSNINAFIGAHNRKENPEDVSNYLKSREAYFSHVTDIAKSDDKLVGFGGMVVESPVIQSEVGGYVLGGIFAGGSAIARTTLSGASKESGAVIKYTTEKLPTFLSEKLFPEVAPTGLTIERGLACVGKIPSLVPSTLSTAERMIEPALTIGGLGYIGYDIASSKTKGEAGAKIAMLGIAYPYAKSGFETGSKLVSRVQTFGLPKTTETDILNPNVESGKETFPTTYAGEFGKFKKEFKTPEDELVGFHATSEGYGSNPITVRGMEPKALRRSDVPGLYISPVKKGASTAFLRLPGATSEEGSSSLKTFFSSTPLKPEIYKITDIGGIKRISGGKNVEKSREFLYSDKPELGTAYIEPKMEMGAFHGEAQAVLPKGTQISSPIKTEKINVKGYDVKYTQRKIITTEQPKISSPIKNINFGKSLEESDSLFSYRGIGETPSSRPLSAIRLPISNKEIKSENFVISSKITPSSKIIPTSNVIVSSKVVTSSKVTPSSKFVTSLIGESSVINTSSKITPSSKIVSSSRIQQPSSIISSLQYPRPYLDRYWNEELRSEIPIDVVSVLNKDGEMERTYKKKKPVYEVKYKKRASPIFGGAEKLFENAPVNPLRPIKKTQVKQSKPSYTKAPRKVETFDLGFGNVKNPMEKTNKIKSKKTNKTKKQFWET